MSCSNRKKLPLTRKLLKWFTSKQFCPSVARSGFCTEYDATGIITAAGAAYRAGKTVVLGVIAKYLLYLGDSIDLSVAGHIFYGLECGENKK
jgi:hypothetical protein